MLHNKEGYVLCSGVDLMCLVLSIMERKYDVDPEVLSTECKGMKRILSVHNHYNMTFDG